MLTITPVYDALLGEIVYHRHVESGLGPYPQPEQSPTISVVLSPLSGVVDSFPLSAADGAEWDYTVSNGCKKRIGEIQSVWNIAGDINNTDTGALDIPDPASTSGVSFQAVTSGSYVALVAVIEPGFGTWQITVDRDLISATPDPNEEHEVFLTGYINVPYSVLDSVPVSAGDGAEWGIVMTDGGVNKRISEIQAVWNIAGDMSFSEVGSIDIPFAGATDALSLSSVMSGGMAHLLGMSTSGSWFYRAERELL